MGQQRDSAGQGDPTGNTQHQEVGLGNTSALPADDPRHVAPYSDLVYRSKSRFPPA